MTDEQKGKLIALMAEGRGVARMLDDAERREDLPGRVRWGKRLREIMAAEKAVMNGREQ